MRRRVSTASIGLAVVGAMGAITGRARATLLMYEPFDYATAGTQLSDADGAGGWLHVASSPDSTDPTIATPGLTWTPPIGVNPLPFTPVGNKITGLSTGTGVLASTNHDLNGQPWTRAENATMYYSLLLNVSNVSGLSVDQTNGAFIAGLRRNTGSSALASFEGGATLLLKQTSTGSGKFNLGIGLTNQTGADRVFDNTDQYDATTGPLLLVASYQFVSGGNDVVKLWINPDPTMSEPNNSTALKASKTSPDFHGLGNSGTNTEASTARIAGFFFRNNGSAPDGWDADELRISTTWEDLWTTVVPGVWLGGTGNWSDAPGWSGSVVPNSASIPVRIDNANALGSTVTLNQDASVRDIVIDAGETLNIDATRTLNLAGPSSAINGVLNNSGTINAAGLTVSGAAAQLNYNAGAINVLALTLSSGGRLTMSPGANKLIKTGSLSVSTGSGSKLDIGDNKLIVVNASVGTFGSSNTYSGLTGLIATGRNSGGWTGAGIVTSQTEATTGNFTSIGIATAQQVKGLATTTDTAVWAGQTVTGGDALVMYTYGGDATLDGKINVDDYGRIDFNIPLGTSGWYNGDFNYDGVINVDDYGIIDFNVGIQGAPFPTSAEIGGVAVVPEPAVGALILAGIATATRLRRRRSPMGFH